MVKQIILSGGLGNQMFQYALYLSLKERGVKCVLNASMYHDIKIHQGYELGRVFGIEGVVINWGKLRRLWLRVLQKFYPTCLVCKDPVITYCEEVYHTKAHYYFGYWMNEAYLRPVADKVCSAFGFHNIDEKNMALVEQMKKQNSVSLHIRRGDYLKDNNYNVCTETYYRNAINLFNEKLDNPHYYVFSDDPQWCESFMKQFNVNYSVVTHNRRTDSYKDMFLMTQCRHNIMANSTFSWWGSWLNNNPEKIVIAPTPWWNINDKTPVCEGWTLISGKEK